MIDIPEECYETRGHVGRVLVCEENGKRICFQKPVGCVADKIRVDGCVIKLKKSCDYLVRDWKGRLHFVELKGQNVEAALAQIEATIPYFCKKVAHQIWCFVICSRVPRATRPGIQSSVARLRKHWNAVTLVKTVEYVHTLS